MSNDIIERLKLQGISESTTKAVFQELLNAAARDDSIPAIPDKNYTAPARPIDKICDPSGLRIIRDVMNVDMDYLDTGDPTVKCYYRTLLDTTEAPHFMPVTLEIDHSTFNWYPDPDAEPCSIRIAGSLQGHGDRISNELGRLLRRA